MAEHVDKHLAALVLDEIASLLALQEAERYRVRAYRTAARAVDRIQGDLGTMLRTGRLADVPGLGPATIGVIRELVETGRSPFYDRLRSETPVGLVRLRGVSGLGPKRIRALHGRLGIETPEDLREAAAAGRVAALPGFGPATQRRILEGLDFVDRSAGRLRQPQAYAVASRLVGHLEALPAVREVRLTGAVRRRCETADAVDLLALTDRPDAVLDAFMATPGLGRARRVGADRATATLAEGAVVRLRAVEPAMAAAALLRETGSAAHLAALEERAARLGLVIDVPADSEDDLYAALGLAWVPPELREGRDELELAEQDRLPDLVSYDDLRGTFHCHTTFSDGRASVAAMADGALARGWRYLGIADHSVSAGYAGGLSVEDIRRQHAEIDRWNDEHGDRLRLFKGIESDILRDGSLDYDDRVLATFDYVIGSVHSGFRMPAAGMTARLVAAAGNPRLTILGHLTGRLLLSREPYPVDVSAVIDAAAAAGAAIEINGDPHRLDLDWRYWPEARARGVPCAIDPDAHSVAGLGAVVYGIDMARKGGLEADDVINTWELERLETWLDDRRRAAT